MPLYQVKCDVCKAASDIFRRIAERDRLPNCACGGSLSRLVSAAAVRGEIEPFVSPYSGKVIHSRTQRRDDMRRGGYIDLEPGAERQISRRRKELQEAEMKPINDLVDNIVTEMNVTGKLETLNV